MAKGTVEKRPLTEDEIADAGRLKRAWETFKAKNEGATQAWLAKETALGNQSLMGQYINAAIPLNPKAVLAYAKVIGIHPAEISPRMNFPVNDNKITPKEAWIIAAYRNTVPVGRLIIDGAVTTSLSLVATTGGEPEDSAAKSSVIPRK